NRNHATFFYEHAYNHLTFPTRQELSQIFENEETAIPFLLNKNIISRPTICSVCLNLNISRKKKMWKCTKKVVENSLRYSKVPFFQNNKLKINKLLEFSYYWLAGIKSKQIVMITECSNKKTTTKTKNLHQLDHLTVYHSVQFVESETGVCIDIIKGTWNALKYKISPRKITNFLNDDPLLDNFLGEFQF
ncbi:hypothetical protein HZS_4439, partial [Henneguya salminicola]